MIRAIALFLLLSASPALAWQARSGDHVTDHGAGRFEVKARPGLGASAAWCAAGDYVIHHLNMPRGTTLWRLSVPPRPAGQGVLFGLSGREAAPASGLLRFGPDSAGLSAAAAEALCDGHGLWATAD